MKHLKLKKGVISLCEKVHFSGSKYQKPFENSTLRQSHDHQDTEQTQQNKHHNKTSIAYYKNSAWFLAMAFQLRSNFN